MTKSGDPSAAALPLVRRTVFAGAVLAANDGNAGAAHSLAECAAN
jgi:hypothetical protein